MTDSDIDQALEKARAFFDRAEQVAATDNFDYAIDMYLEGLRRAPDALEDGHVALRRCSLIRQGKGGKKPSVVDKLKRKGGKDPLEKMLNAEYLLAKDPDNLDYARSFMKAATEGGWYRTAEWVADLVFSGMSNLAKPNVNELLQVKECYAKLGIFEKAVNVAALASKLKPGDGILADEVKNLSAQSAMKKGKYGEAGGFQHSIKDKELQDKLHSQDVVIKSEDFKEKAVDDARKLLETEKESFSNRMKLCDALAEVGTKEAFAEAIELLERYFQETSDFGYKKRRFELEIKYYRQKLVKARKIYAGNTADEKVKTAVDEINAKILQLEFDYYTACVDNNPTELKYKYELATRYVLRHQFDEAIPLFQEARREPRLKFHSMDKMGICFFYKGWYEDAIDIFKEAVHNYEFEDDNLGKELRYNLARSYEEAGKGQDALEIFRRLAQIDYDYKDIRKRIDSLRADFQ